MDNFIGLDAHSKSCTFVAINKDGEIIKEGKFATNERNLIDLVSRMEGKTSLMFEETNIAQWIYCVLNDKTDKLIVCHPAYLPKKSGPKNDYRDAAHLAIQLRAGNYTNVFHEDNPLMYLTYREAARIAKCSTGAISAEVKLLKAEAKEREKQIALEALMPKLEIENGSEYESNNIITERTYQGQVFNFASENSCIELER